MDRGIPRTSCLGRFSHEDMSVGSWGFGNSGPRDGNPAGIGTHRWQRAFETANSVLVGKQRAKAHGSHPVCMTFCSDAFQPCFLDGPFCIVGQDGRHRPFIFYDTETTGADRSFDQILQFAAALTDDDLNVVDSFEIRCRLLPHIVPSPGAMVVTGVRVDQLFDLQIPSHYEMCRRIYEVLTA